ncbi:hypothetical protein SASPL_125814 [Salvia splendens]|uniref:C2H2-type domain-containing protein n=1 Tax=Salvia splendens TaxID=180675 RepID=A0A8X8ZQD5_SALSN|nr:hypothetical protein SASPL_125814 [Salvia splendens]
MNNYNPNTFLNLSLSSGRVINLGLGFDAPAPDWSPASNPLRVFSCNYCRRKLHSSQALGGHQIGENHGQEEPGVALWSDQLGTGPGCYGSSSARG